MALDGLIVRKVVKEDIEVLMSMLVESHPNQDLKISRSSLERDLTCGKEIEFTNERQVLNKDADATIEFDLRLAKSNVPVFQAFLATIGHDNKKPAGFLVFHYFYSPWKGHAPFVNQIYVRPEHRNQGIASRLFDELRSHCKREGIKQIVYDMANIEPGVQDRIAKYGTRVLRNNQSDWGVYRIKSFR